jgi:hypothetical protein
MNDIEELIQNAVIAERRSDDEGAKAIALIAVARAIDNVAEALSRAVNALGER